MVNYKRLFLLTLIISITIILSLIIYMISTFKYLRLDYDPSKTIVVNGLKYTKEKDENGEIRYTVDGIFDTTLKEFTVEDEIKGIKVTSINTNAFFNSKIEKVTLGANIKYIEDQAFYLSNVEEIIFNSKLQIIGMYAFRYCNYLTEITLPDSVVTVDYGAFFSCMQLKKFTTNISLQSINTYAFYGCERLEEVTIKGETIIGYGAFFNCLGLERVDLGDAFEIHDFAFQNCFLTQITIPSTITFLGENIFRYCYNLEEVNYCGTIEEWNELIETKNIGLNDFTVINSNYEE